MQGASEREVEFNPESYYMFHTNIENANNTHEVKRNSTYNTYCQCDIYKFIKPCAKNIIIIMQQALQVWLTLSCFNVLFHYFIFLSISLAFDWPHAVTAELNTTSELQQLWTRTRNAETRSEIPKTRISQFFLKKWVLTKELRFYCNGEPQNLQVIMSPGGTSYVLSQGGSSYTSLMNQVIAQAKSSNQNYEEFLSSEMTGSFMDILNEPFPLEVFTCSLHIQLNYFVCYNTRWNI